MTENPYPPDTVFGGVGSTPVVFPELGTRWTLRQPVTRHPNITASIGMDGTVVEIGGRPERVERICLKMDDRLDGADGLDNCIVWVINADQDDARTQFLADCDPIWTQKTADSIREYQRYAIRWAAEHGGQMLPGNLYPPDAGYGPAGQTPVEVLTHIADMADAYRAGIPRAKFEATRIGDIARTAVNHAERAPPEPVPTPSEADQMLRALIFYGWSVKPASFYDEEGVEGWIWTDQHGNEYDELGMHDDLPRWPEDAAAALAEYESKGEHRRYG
jgi:hypothetical protein